MGQIYGSRLLYLRNDISMQEIDLNIANIAQICGKGLKYIRNGFTMLEMA